MSETFNPQPDQKNDQSMNDRFQAEIQSRPNGPDEPSVRSEDELAVSLTQKLDDLDLSRFKILTDPEMRQKLADRVFNLVEQVKEKNITNLVFLDKSARPLVTLFSSLWKKLSPNAPKPKISFINVGKEILGEERVDFGSMSTQEYEWPIKQQALDEIAKKYQHLSSAAGNERILIVEEYTHSGKSMRKAIEIFSSIFPEVEFEGFSVSDNEENVIFEGGEVPWSEDEQSGDYGSSLTGVSDAEEIFSGETLVAKPTIALVREKQQEIADAKQELNAKLPEYKKQLMAVSDELTPYINPANFHIPKGIAKQTKISHQEAINIGLKLYKHLWVPEVSGVKSCIDKFQDLESADEIISQFDQQGHYNKPKFRTLMSAMELWLGHKGYITVVCKDYSDLPEEYHDDIFKVIHRIFGLFNQGPGQILSKAAEIYSQLQKVAHMTYEGEADIVKWRESINKSIELRKEMQKIADVYQPET